MSQIFDAIQKAEAGKAGANPPFKAGANVLLEQAEQRAADNWESAAMGGDNPLPEAGLGLLSAEFEKEAVTADWVDPAAVVEAPPSDKPAPAPAYQSLKIESALDGRLVSWSDPSSPGAEAYRLLGVRLSKLKQERPLKRLLITSTVPMEGKTLTAANLAIALAAKTNERVLLIEGDLRQPSLASTFGFSSGLTGLSEFLQGKQDLTTSIYRVEKAGFWLLPAGAPPANPLELLQSPRVPLLVESLSALYDWILIDSPPILPLADTSIWTAQSDGILLVTRQGATAKGMLRKGIQSLDSSKLIGSIVNSSTPHPRYSYGY